MVLIFYQDMVFLDSACLLLSGGKLRSRLRKKVDVPGRPRYADSGAKAREQLARYAVESVRVAILRTLPGMRSYRELSRLI